MGCIPIKKTKPLNIRRTERRFSEDTLSIIEDFSAICHQYRYKRSLGRGKYGRIFLAESVKTNQQVAIKAISRIDSTITEVTKEIEILTEVDHPNIVKYFNHYLSDKYLYVVMEYCEGEELFAKIAERKKFPESKVRAIMEKLLRVINHCHYHDIIHCDLKPENIICSSENILKVIDFGLSKKLNKASYGGISGTAYYIAPEIIKSGLYTKACDIWSLGMTMHVMLSGYVPIEGEEFAEIAKNIRNYEGLTFNSKIWKGISEEAKDLLTRMLDPNHNTRITAAEALNHPWFISRTFGASFCDAEILEALQKYSEFSETKKDLLRMIVKNVTDTELKKYQERFLELDKEKTGLITSSSLEEALNESENRISRKELEELTKKVNSKGDAFISYSEFVSALIATKEFLTEERLSSIFKILEVQRINVLQRSSLTSDVRTR